MFGDSWKKILGVTAIIATAMFGLQEIFPILASNPVYHQILIILALLTGTAVNPNKK